MQKKKSVLIRHLLLLLFVLLAYPCNICAQNNASEEIKITLQSDKPLFMASVAKIDNTGSAFPESYLDSLVSVISFDFDNNGSTYIPEHSIQQQITAALSTKEAKTIFPSDILSKLGLAYLIQMKMTGKVLETTVYGILSNTSRTLNGITCTGSLDEDRKKLHEISSFIHQMLFNSPSIATSKLLWVKKYRSSDKSNESKYTSEIIVSDYDGYNRQPISPHMDTLLTTPLWIPRIRPGYVSKDDSAAKTKPQAFAFVSYQLGQAKLFFSPLSPFKPLRVTSLKGNQMTPAISFDGTKIAFACDTTGTSDLFLVEYNQATGSASKPRQLYRSTGSATGSPCFSPDGKQIAFVSNKDGSPRIYIMEIPPISTKLADIKPRLLTKRCSENSAPAWSPDGKKLAFSGRSGKESRQIWIYDFATQKEYSLTEGQGDKESPSWAPNSLHVAFHCTMKDGSSSIYLASLRKPIPVCIVKGKEAFQFASWEPSISTNESNTKK